MCNYTFHIFCASNSFKGIIGVHLQNLLSHVYMKLELTDKHTYRQSYIVHVDKCDCGTTLAQKHVKTFLN